ncbi:MAG TPA: lamin tail domain-containing protein, partial [Verrucomicrobiae bacterium]|nr:lamin tail domain-containing protein [Verrucomicrobiae bacterium]
PSYGQDAVVTARLHDPDGLKSLVLNYRLDPDTAYTKVTMTDDGTGGDAVAHDGLYSATIPGTYGLVAYYLSATDNRLATTRFPALLNDNSPIRECSIMFGDTDPGGSFATYHLWLTQSNIDRWNSLPILSNEMIDGTFVNGSRVIYGMGARYAGSPYHQNFYDPRYSACHFKFLFPDDDKFLGATSYNKIHAPGNGAGDDASLQREQTAYTFMRALGVPWLNRRYVGLLVNGNRSMPLMEDTQCPDADMVKEYFPNDSDGYLYKMQPWFEFVPFPSGTYLDFNNAAWCAVVPYTTTGRVKKTAHYRYTFEVRRTPDSANNFTNVFSLIDAANASGGPNYAADIESIADMENWMRVFAANHAAGNWDSFGTQNGQNLYGYIGTQGTRYSLLMFDFNIVLGNSGSWGPGANLYTVNSADNNMLRIYNTPVFRRMYVRALAELVKGPLDVANTGPLIDAKCNTFVANGLNVENTSAIKAWLTSARASINAQINGQITAAFSVNPAVQITGNMATFSGGAPVGVKTILINGVQWPVTWNSVIGWAITVPLQPGTNVFSIVGIDIHGQPVPGATGVASAVFDGTPASPQGQVVLNEIMANPQAPNAEYMELYNASTNSAFDLSGWQIQALGYTFPAGSLIGPDKYLVLARDRAAFAASYGATVPVFDTFSVPLPADGQTLALLRPVGGESPETVAEVRFETVQPWPSGSSTPKSSLQLVDSTQDNWRVGNWAVSTTGAVVTPGAANNVRTNLPDFPPLVLNELQADNLTGIRTSAGTPAPWVELFNFSTNPIALEGL